mgnify:CR=1 FL=1
MSKFVRSINIEETVWNEAKTKFPNLSQFIEDFLKAALLSENNDEIQLRQTQIRLQQEIVAKQTELTAIESKLNNVTAAKQDNSKMMDNEWRRLFMTYKDTHWHDESLEERFMEVSGLSEDVLRELMEEVYIDLKHGDGDQNKIRFWSFVEENYLKGGD